MLSLALPLTSHMTLGSHVLSLGLSFPEDL